MVAGDVLEELSANLSTMAAEAMAVGVVTPDLTEFACAGQMAGVDVDQDTVFYGASVTKQMVGLMLARVVADGSAGVDDPVLRWLPELPSWTSAVQIGHLIHHTSDRPDLTDPSLGTPCNNAELIHRYQHLPAPPRLAPGTRYHYNNAGYVLLAEVVSRTLDQPISDAASARLFAPLAMRRTRLGGDPIRPIAVPDPPGTIGDGGLWTTVADLTRWLKASNDKRAGAQVQDLAETAGQFADGSSNEYAWGARVSQIPYGRLITHGGTWHSWLAKTARVPEHQVAVAVLSLGGTEDDISNVATRLARALAGRYAAPGPHRASDSARSGITQRAS